MGEGLNTWTHAMCDACWNARRSPDYPPVRMVDPETETCCWCGQPTDSGIYVREDPRFIRFIEGHIDHASTD